MLPPHDPRRNHLLAALPGESYRRLLPDLELSPLPLGWVLYETGECLDYLYFPIA